jgi:Kef-type K+ transport system membrane component KefB
LDLKIGHKRRVSIIALSCCFFLAYLAELLGVAGIIGAYAAGVILCNSKSVEYIESKANVLSYMIFSPFFFVSIGQTMSFTGYTAQTILFAGLLLLVAILSKAVGSGIGAKFCRFTTKESIQIGFGMVSRGEIALIVAMKGASVGLVNNDVLPSIIVVVIMTTLIAPILLKIVYKDNSGLSGKH